MIEETVNQMCRKVGLISLAIEKKLLTGKWKLKFNIIKLRLSKRLTLKKYSSSL